MGCSSSAESDVRLTANHDDKNQDRFQAKYSIGAKIAAGAYGQVRACSYQDEALNQQSKGELAVKILDARNGVMSDQALQNKKAKERKKELKLAKHRLHSMLDEIDMWKLLGSSDHIVRLVDHFIFHYRVFLIMERCENTLLDEISVMESISEKDLAGIFLQMAKGLQAVHGAGVVHRDIKPENYLCGGEDGKTLKLCDFGLAAVVPQTGELTGICGTPPYMSPEMLTKTHSFPTDIWSLGAFVYLMLYGQFPYMPSPCDADAMKLAIALDSPAIAWTRKEEFAPSQQITDFAKALLQRNPEKRITIAGVLELPLLQKVARRWARKEEKAAAAKAKAEKLDDARQLEQAAYYSSEACYSSEAVEQDEPEVLVAVVRRAAKQATTASCKPPVDATMQRSLDEVLKRLGAHDGGASLKKSFSGSFADEVVKKEEASSAFQNEPSEVISRRGSRASTHSGVLSGTLSLAGKTPKAIEESQETTWESLGETLDTCSTYTPNSSSTLEDGVNKEKTPTKPSRMPSRPVTPSGRIMTAKILRA